MVATATLGDIVQQDRSIKHLPRLHLVDDFRRERQVVGERALFDLVQNADRPDRMLVRGINVVHVVLHLCDHPSEVGDELPEDTGLVEPPERFLGIGWRHQHFHEQSIRGGVFLRRAGQPSQAAGDKMHRVRVNIQLAPLRHFEQAEHFSRLVLEMIS